MSNQQKTSVITSIPPPSALPSFIIREVEGGKVSTEGITGTNSIYSKQNQSRDIAGKSNDEDLASNANKLNLSSSEVSTDLSLSNSKLPSSSKLTHPLSIPMLQSDSDTTSKMAQCIHKEVASNTDGWMGWIKGTVHSVGSKVAEKAKTSMDNMITTLDPQMKEFINSGGDVDVIVASAKEVKVNPVREAFQGVFGKATVSGFDSNCDGFAAQPVGFSAALQAAESRINNLRAAGKIHPQHPVVAIEGFLVDFANPFGNITVPQPGLDCDWVEMCVLLLDDPWHDIILKTYSQPTPVPQSLVDYCQLNTQEDYSYKDTGFATTIGYAVADQLKISPQVWQEELTGVKRRETLLLAARTLAGLYRNKLPTDVI